MIKLILVVVISYISLSDACSCFLPEGWQKQAVCNSEFAGKIKVLSDGYPCEYKLCYDIQVVQQYKGTPVAVTLNVLETNTDSAACGVYLTQGNTYFVATNPISANKIGVYLCSLFEDWSNLSCCEMIEKAKAYRCDGVGPIEVPIDFPIDIPIEGPIEGPIELPIEGPIELPIEGPIKGPIRGPIKVPIEGPIEVPIEEGIVFAKL